MPPLRLSDYSASEFATPSRFVEVRALRYGGTNVRPLLREGVRSEFDATRGYLTGASVYEARLRWARWELRYAYGQADLYEGNAGAARLFLEAEQARLRPDTNYAVFATLNRSAVHRWTVVYHGEARIPNARGRYQLGLSYLNLQRVQQGWLQGQKQGDTFAGALTLLTTRGIPAAAVDGVGYTLSAGIALETDRWGASLQVEDLWSWLRVRQAQRIEANVAVNRLTPDADGFLRAPPLLAGRVADASLQRTARPHAEMTLWRREGARQYGLLARYDEAWHTGLAIRWNSHRSAFWAAYWQPQPILWLGYETPHWQLTLGTDNLRRDALYRFYFEFRWRFALE